MIKIGGRTYSLMILFAIALHYWWALGLLIGPAAMNATGIHIFHRMFGIGPIPLAATFLTVASLSLISLLQPLGRYTITLMLPQQATLMISAFAAITAITLQHFADGVERPMEFIFNDQGYSILAAVFHTMAMLGRVGEIRINRSD